MANDYISQLRQAIKAAHGCESIHIESLPARQAFGAHAAVETTVELFLIGKHPKASWAYAWGIEEADGWRITTALKLPRERRGQASVYAMLAAAAPTREAMAQR